MRLEFVKGDLIEMVRLGKLDAVAHGCNCFHTMGSGIAPQLNNLTDGYLLKSDKQQSPYGDINKLGDFSLLTYFVNSRKVIFGNLYTQFSYGSNNNGEIYIHWDSFLESMRGFLEVCDGRRVGIPYIGCGLAGGSEYVFRKYLEILEKEFSSSSTVLYVVEYHK